jgi:hypothetical protein
VEEGVAGGGVIVKGGGFVRGVVGEAEESGEVVVVVPLVAGGGVVAGMVALVLLSLFLTPVVFPDFRRDKPDMGPFPLSPNEGFLPSGAGSNVTDVLDDGWRGNVRMSSSSVVDVSAGVGLVAVEGRDEELLLLLLVLLLWSLALDSGLLFA